MSGPLPPLHFVCLMACVRTALLVVHLKTTLTSLSYFSRHQTSLRQTATACLKNTLNLLTAGEVGSVVLVCTVRVGFIVRGCLIFVCLFEG